MPWHHAMCPYAHHGDKVTPHLLARKKSSSKNISSDANQNVTSASDDETYKAAQTDIEKSGKCKGDTAIDKNT